jgi:hypothetical protein
MAMVSDFEVMHLHARLRDLMAALGPMAQDVVLLKGAALGLAVYADPRARPMRDLDILVPPGRTEMMRQLAVRQGWAESAPAGEAFYAAHQHVAPLTDGQGTGLELEIHTEVLAGRHPFAFGGHEVRARCVEVPGHGVACRVPSLAHQVIHLSLHFAWSHKMSTCAWRTCRDLHAVTSMDAFDWQLLVVDVEAAGAGAACYWALAFAATYTGLVVPEEVLCALRRYVPPGSHWVLARHLALQMSALEVTCPSEALSRWCWAQALGLTGHRGSIDDPWERDRLLRLGPPTAWPPRRAPLRRLWTQSRKLLAYAGRVVG